MTEQLTYSNMPPPYDDDSDFDSDEECSEVQLGLTDGPLESEDEANPLVSRIGGRPVWLPLAPNKLPPVSLVHCQYCQKPMQLLVQIFAPLENSAYDRNLFVWGCPRAACQRKGPGRYVFTGALEDDLKFLHLMRCICFYEKKKSTLTILTTESAPRVLEQTYMQYQSCSYAETQSTLGC